MKRQSTSFSNVWQSTKAKYSKNLMQKRACVYCLWLDELKIETPSRKDYTFSRGFCLGSFSLVYSSMQVSISWAIRKLKLRTYGLKERRVTWWSRANYTLQSKIKFHSNTMITRLNANGIAYVTMKCISAAFPSCYASSWSYGWLKAAECGVFESCAKSWIT